MPRPSRFIRKRHTSPRQHRTGFNKRYLPKLENLECRVMLTATPEIIVADDVPALTAAYDVAGFRDVLVQPSGKVVAAGSFDSALGDDFTLVRYMADGSQLDGSFGNGGIVQTNFSSGGKPDTRHDTLWGAEVDSQGRIVVSGQDNRGNLVVGRYTPDGELDNSFSGDGFDKTSTSFDESLQTIAVDADDNVYVVGRSDEYVGSLGRWNDTLRVVKYTSAGNVDLNFGENGVFSYTQRDLADTSDPPFDRNLGVVVYEPASSPGQTKLLISGTFGNNVIQTREAFLLRLNAAGSPDTTFGQDGVITTNLPFDGDPTHHNYGNGVAIDNSDPSAPDRIVQVGLSTHGMNRHSLYGRWPT